MEGGLVNSRLIRNLRHEALDTPEFAPQLEATVTRLEQAETQPAYDAPMIYRATQWRINAATCKKCGAIWHSGPIDNGCPTSIFNLRD